MLDLAGPQDILYGWSELTQLPEYIWVNFHI